jgi:4-carboxymuconolactone decarboxylase
MCSRRIGQLPWTGLRPGPTIRRNDHENIDAIGCRVLTMAAGGTDMQRLPPLQHDEMTPAQRTVADAIMAGPRGSLGGPFKAWLYSPVLADRLQKVGEYIRFDSSLPKRLNEFAILIVGRSWNASYEWYAHEPMATKAGLKQEIADQVRDGKRPHDMSEDETLVYEFCTQLLHQHQVSDAAYRGIADMFGEQGVVDLIGVVGYYSVVSMTLNVAQVRLPEGAPLAVPPPPVPA